MQRTRKRNPQVWQSPARAWDTLALSRNCINTEFPLSFRPENPILKQRSAHFRKLVFQQIYKTRWNNIIAKFRVSERHGFGDREKYKVSEKTAKTFRAYYESHKSFCVCKPRWSREMKLWNEAVLSYFVNLFKDQEKSRKANCESATRQFWKLFFFYMFSMNQHAKWFWRAFYF